MLDLRMRINKNSPVPVYYQLRNVIIEKIESGEYTEENLIPSEREISEELGISRMTVRQALNQLVSEGYLVREKGRGTFVAKARLHQKNISSFSDTVRAKGMTPHTKILNFEKIECEEALSKELDIPLGTKVYNIKRLRSADNTPIAIEEIFIPEQFCQDIEKQDLTQSFYKLLEKYYGYSIHHTDSMIEAVVAKKAIREQLGIKQSVPILGITSIVYAENNVKLWFEKSIYRSDKYVYNVRLFM